MFLSLILFVALTFRETQRLIVFFYFKIYGIYLTTFLASFPSPNLEGAIDSKLQQI